jgi:hypothetical protein
VNQYVDRHFIKLEKELGKIDRATESINRLAHSIHIME